MISDLHIIGAGPAGTLSALSAIRNNFNPIISEEHPKVGVPTHCSGLLSKSGLESLSEFVNYKKCIINKFNGAIIDFSGVKVEIGHKGTIAYKIDRASFDQELASNAEKEGAKINYNERIREKFYSENIIGADGPLSAVASYFNFPRIERFVSTAQTTAKHISEDPSKVYLYYSNDLFPGFFGWVIPKNEEYAEIGCGSLLPNSPKKGFELFLKQLNISSKNISHAIIPIRVRRHTSASFGKKNILLVGDAAGQTKASTGGGILFGGNCAILAGKHANNPKKYEKEWKEKFGFDLKMHSLIQSFLEKRSEDGLRRIGQFLNSTDLDSYLSKSGDMDKPSKMLNFNIVLHFLRNLF